MTGASLMHEAGHPVSALGQGRWVQDGGAHKSLWPIHVDVWQKPTQYCKVIILQFK